VGRVCRSLRWGSGVGAPRWHAPGPASTRWHPAQHLSDRNGYSRPRRGLVTRPLTGRRIRSDLGGRDLDNRLVALDLFAASSFQSGYRALGDRTPSASSSHRRRASSEELTHSSPYVVNLRHTARSRGVENGMARRVADTRLTGASIPPSASAMIAATLGHDSGPSAVALLQHTNLGRPCAPTQIASRSSVLAGFFSQVEHSRSTPLQIVGRLERRVHHRAVLIDFRSVPSCAPTRLRRAGSRSAPPSPRPFTDGRQFFCSM